LFFTYYIIFYIIIYLESKLYSLYKKKIQKYKPKWLSLYLYFVYFHRAIFIHVIKYIKKFKKPTLHFFFFILIAYSVKLVGSIPSSFFNISTLQGIYLQENKLSSTMPSISFNTSTVLFIDLYFNKLSGELPEDMFSHLPSLQKLDLSFNQFCGKLASTLFKCKKLQYVSLWSNKHTGRVP
jgi:hypothetical protein